MRIRRPTIALASFLVVAASITAGAATKTVTIRDQSFEPRRITIYRGDTVRWVVDDNQRHTVTASPDSRSQGVDFDSSPSCPGFGPLNDCLRNGQTFANTFDTRGTFTYYCKRHGTTDAYPNCGMCGQVVVARRPTPPSSPPATSPTITPSTKPSSPSPSVSPTAGATTSPSAASPRASGSSGGSGGIVAIAIIAVIVLGGSGYVVYRRMIQG